MATANSQPPILQPPKGRTTSTINNTVRIDGNIFSSQDLIVDGQVDGNIEMPGHNLTVGPNAAVKADIKAQDVLIIGHAEGNVEASGLVELGAQCRVLGEIRTARILIQEGAYFKGGVDIIVPGKP